MEVLDAEVDTMERRIRAEELRPTVAAFGGVVDKSHGRGSRCLFVKAGHVALTSHRSMALRRFKVLRRFREGLRVTVA